MTSQWVVLLKTTSTGYTYGPFDDEALAEHFADFLTTEVDPASVVPLRSPVAELIGWYRQHTTPDVLPAPKPAGWPPHPGQVWQDRNGDRWIATPVGNPTYLICLARKAHDGAEDIWRMFGPLTLVQQIITHEEEPPF